jgi:hypothetical protein
LPVPFVTFHRDDQPSYVRAAAESRAPVVAAETGEGDVVVLAGPDELEKCAASPKTLIEVIESALAAHDLVLPE